MPLQIQIETTDTATPLLKQLAGLKSDRTPLHGKIANRAAVLTRLHLLGLQKHATASRLGAQPTNYFETKAESIEARATADEAVVAIATGGGQEAFARVNGPVTVNARNKYLTIPATAAAYGRRAKDFTDLKFIPFASGARAIVKQTVEMVTGKRGKPIKKIVNQVFYWLKESVVLPMDRTLLPDDEAFGQAAEQGANDYFDDIETPERSAA